MDEITKTNFADIAESTMSMYMDDKRNSITTSQIRNILSKIVKLGEKSKELKSISNQLTDDELAQIQYIKMRVAYDAGRDNKVKAFVEKAEIMDQINSIGNDRERLDVFYNYFEALVAYHRYYGGKDK